MFVYIFLAAILRAEVSPSAVVVEKVDQDLFRLVYFPDVCKLNHK